MSTVGPTNPLVPAIYKIGNDLLYEIFFLGTCREIELWGCVGYPDSQGGGTINHSPLEDIRRASQVCRTWRDILLHSPSIWARCMDFDAFGQKRNNWRELVLKRTGQSPLSIMVRHRNRPTSPLFHFLEDLLDKQWTRIAELHLTMDSTDVHSTRIAEPLRRPAENLRVFVLRPAGGWLRLHFQLFRGNARRLQCLWLPSVYKAEINFKSSTMVTSNLRYLELHDFNIDDLLTACLRMPLLEILKLRISDLNTGNSSEGTSLPCPVMPRLEFLDLCCPMFDIYPSFLDRVTPSDGCRLHMVHPFDTRFQTPNISIISLQCMQTVICRYANSIFSEHQGGLNFGNVVFSISPRGLSFSCYDNRLHISFPGSHVVAVHHLLDTISTLALPGTLDLKILDLRGEQGSYLPHFDNGRKVIQVFRSMHLIDTLQIHDDQFYKLHKDHGSDILFPSLKKLILGGNSNVDIITTALPFLAQRHTIAPVEVLEINLDYRNSILWNAIHSLDGLAGLKVVWNRYGKPYQYICGGNELRRGLK
ncbi:hypothetical protein HYPSUDRAFT_526195 [Hypholoma sublateritium FD-334 SS-4]|uniref:Uncharacterized protein n=1 Tax=Hypholoma sublateritium (strain FD-334 SS-4) TaxID=945553 RepID=A0A0D2MKT0_HYPSF|nr:hypothetical protein HYPSUDRAFT_526195 [Hypholoma sublateritium FD-334 SS-4]